ncbi:MAG TPA: hypothetical protein VMN39_06600, partial [Longimicrobiaceae bacterium]|nr:hypothetical protein [Longimicrobiaceae bacterium]
MSDDLDGRYRLLEQVTEPPVRTFHALTRAGAVVMVHHIDGGPDGEAERVRSKIDQLDPAVRRSILEVHDAAGSLAIVTKFILDFDSFPAWLDSNQRASPPTTVAATAPPIADLAGAEHAQGAGEFTRIFRTAASGSENTEGPAAAETPPELAGNAEGGYPTTSIPDPPPGPDTANAAVPSVGADPEVWAEPPSLPPASAPERSDEAGGAMLPEADPFEPSAAQAAPGPGEFTRAFTAFTEPAVEPVEPPASAEPPSPPPASAPER